MRIPTPTGGIAPKNQFGTNGRAKPLPHIRRQSRSHEVHRYVKRLVAKLNPVSHDSTA
jgi:hypothetical protein